jgi:exonuclease SbcC
VCGTPLDADHRKTVRTSLQEQSRALDGQMKGSTSELETVRKEAARCADDVRRLKRSVTEREKLVGVRDALRARLEQRRRLEQELAELDTAAAEDEARLTEQHSAAAALAAEIAALPGARKSAAGVSERLEAARQTARVAEADVARLTERLGSAQKAQAALIEAREAEATAAVEQRRYQRLSTAFGRGGIPDLIIDNARPELEQEANRVLGALTNGEMSVHFRLQRDTKSGKARETFEALVRPHDGDVRDFAMFSGGEAFRVAFAVRLAMSKLLVRRAGARLETLVIDEGFGTQDPEGRERLVEAINLARTEFAKILVITHLDDLKDLFGTQIRVTKDRAGSVLTLAQA